VGKPVVERLCMSAMPRAAGATPVPQRLQSRRILHAFILAKTCSTRTRTRPYAIVLLRAMFAAVPHEVIEAGMLDGCNRFSTSARAVIPLSIPGLSTVGMIAFLWDWGDLLALTLTGEESKRVVTTGRWGILRCQRQRLERRDGVLHPRNDPPLVVFLFSQYRSWPGRSRR
jgi:ABC-type glycerol-3-phosphate transport system permease component